MWLFALALLILGGCGDSAPETKAADQSSAQPFEPVAELPLSVHSIVGRPLADGCQPSVTFAQFGDPAVPADPTLFHASRSGTDLRIDLAAGRYAPPATYTLTVALPAPCAKDAKDVKDAAETVKDAAETVKVDVPAVTVDHPAKVQVEVRRHLWGKDEVTSSPLRLHPTGRRGLTNVGVALDGVLSGTDGSDPARVAVSAVPRSILAGKRVEGTPTLVGSLSPGKHTGTLEVSASELDAPLTVPVEVDVRIWPIDIAAVVFAGVSLGVLLRGFLPGLKDRAEARAGLLSSMDALHRFAAAQGDPPTAEALREQARKLEDMAEQRLFTLEQARAAISTAETARDDALTKLGERRAAVVGELRSTSERVRAHYPLPGPIVIAVEAWQGEARRRLERDNIEAAEGLVGTDGKGLLELLDGAARVWSTEVRQAFDAATSLGDLNRCGPADQVTIPKKTRSSEDTLDTALDAAEASARAFADRLDAQAGALGRLRASITRLRRANVPGHDTAAAEVVAVLDAFDRTLIGASPGAGPVAVRDVAARLPPALESLLTLHAKAGPEATRTAVEEALAASRYEAAILKLTGAPTDIVEGLESFVPDGRAARMPFAIPTRSAFLSPARPGGGELVRVPIARGVHWGSTALWHAGSALVIALGAYAMYVDGFVGTGKEFVGIFLWAFGLDYTVATLKDQYAGAVRAPSSGRAPVSPAPAQAPAQPPANGSSSTTTEQEWPPRW